MIRDPPGGGTEANEREAARVTAVPRITAVSGPSAGRGLAMTSALATVGRHPTNDLVLDDPRVSGVHLELRRVGDRVHVRDAGSTNGTWHRPAPHRRGRARAGRRDHRRRRRALRVDVDESATAARRSTAGSFGELVGESARDARALRDARAHRPQGADACSSRARRAPERRRWRARFTRVTAGRGAVRRHRRDVASRSRSPNRCSSVTSAAPSRAPIERRAGFFEAAAGRHRLPRRDRRAAAADPVEVPARARAARGHARRRHGARQGRRARRRRDAPRSPPRDRGRPLPRGPLLPARADPPRSPAAARSPGGRAPPLREDPGADRGAGDAARRSNPRPSRTSRRSAGPATSASFATSSRARPRWRRARRSAGPTSRAKASASAERARSDRRSTSPARSPAPRSARSSASSPRTSQRS